MKKISFTAILLITSVLCFAQEPEVRKPRKEEKKIWMQLSLSENQKQKLKELKEEKRNQLQALEKDDNIRMKDYRTKKAAIQKDAKLKMQALLNPEQKQKLDEIKKERQEKRSVKAKERLEHLKAELNLTDDQYKKIASLQENTMGRIKAIRNNDGLTDDQKKQEIKQMRQTQKKALHALLSDVQLSKLDEIKKNKRKER